MSIKPIQYYLVASQCYEKANRGVQTRCQKHTGDRWGTPVAAAMVLDIDAAERLVDSVNLGPPTGSCKAQMSVTCRACPKGTTNTNGEQKKLITQLVFLWFLDKRMQLTVVLSSMLKKAITFSGPYCLPKCTYATRG